MKPFDPLRFARRAANDPETRERMIAEAAYYRSERRGFVPGHEVADWIEAEREVDARLSVTARISV
jgi:hypothetical protein